jgi:UDP-glucose 4-epimerase
VRYGNVLASRGSVIPLFHQQIRRGGPLTITTREMTRFLLGLDQAVDAIVAALPEACRGELYVPRIRSARIADLADLLIGDQPIRTVVSGVRPGEKVHEILVSEEEAHRTVARGDYYVILPILPELRDGEPSAVLGKEFSSADAVMDREELAMLLQRYDLLLDHPPATEEVPA